MQGSESLAVMSESACMHAQLLSHVQLFAIPWTIARQAPLSMEFSRQEHWSGQPFPPLGALPNPGIKPGSPALQADSLPTEPQLICLSESSTFLSF